MKLFLLIFLIVEISYSQWSKSVYPESSLFVCPGFTPTIKVMPDGSSFVFGRASFNLWLQKLDPYGYKMWEKPIHVYENAGSNNVGGIESVLDPQGGIIFLWRDEIGAEEDALFRPTQNSLFLQHIDKMGNKLLGPKGKIVAPLEGGLKVAYCVEDGFGGIILFIKESDFHRKNSANIERTSLVRYDASGNKLWEQKIDSSYNQGDVPINPLYRVKSTILIPTLSGQKIIHLDGTISSKVISKPINAVSSNSDSSLLSVSRSMFSDSSGNHFDKFVVGKYSVDYDLEWETSYISTFSVDTGDGSISVLPNIVHDGIEGLYVSNGFYILSPRSFHIYIQHIGKNGPSISGSGINIFASDWPIYAVTNKGDLGIIYNNYTYQKYSLDGDSLFKERQQLLYSENGELSNSSIVSDKNGGVLIAFWNGGIHVQHSGRNGKLGEISNVNSSLSPTISFELQQNFPNPFNPSTTIHYALPKSGTIVLKVYDVLGKEVATLVDTHQKAGRYSVVFDASSLSSGMYIYKLMSDKHSEFKKMMFIK